MTAKRHRCDYCGEDLGVFEHSFRDGPLSCGNPECSRQCARDEREIALEERDRAREEAERDGFARYGGGGW